MPRPFILVLDNVPVSKKTGLEVRRTAKGKVRPAPSKRAQASERSIHNAARSLANSLGTQCDKSGHWDVTVEHHVHLISGTQWLEIAAEPLHHLHAVDFPRQDTINIAETVLDALQKVIYEDDRQVSNLVAKRVYHE